MSDTDLIKEILNASESKKRELAAVIKGTSTATRAPKSTRILTITETAKRLGVSRTTTYKLIRTGKLRTVEAGGDSRVLEQSLLDYLGI